MELTDEDIDQFLEDRPRAESYRDLCANMLRPFKRGIGDEELNADIVKRYGKSRYKDKPSSYNIFLAVVKSFANWKMKRLPQEDMNAYIRDRSVLELIQDIRRDKVVMRLERKELSTGDLKTIFGSVDGQEFSSLWSLAWFGCRPSEIVRLTMKDINKDPDRYLPEALAAEMSPDDYCVKFVTSKTVVERAVFMDGFTKRHLENMISSGTDYRDLYDTCVGLQDTIGADFTPKWFRSTFQTKFQRILAQASIPMVKLDILVKVMSGHTVAGDITGIYTDFGADIKRAMTELHFMKPLEGEFESP